MHKDYSSIYRYIKHFQTAFPGTSPSFREIGDAFGLSTSIVSSRLKDMVEDGILIMHGEGQSRSICAEGYFLVDEDLKKLGVDMDKIEALRKKSKVELKGIIARGDLG